MKTILFSITLVLVLCTGHVEAADTPSIKLYYDSAYLLPGTRATNIITIPLKITTSATLKAKDVKMDKPLYARNRSVFDKSYLDAFRITFDSASSSLQVTVEMNRLPAAGIYELMLVFTAPKQNKFPLPIFFIRPAAELVVDTPVNIIVEENLGPGMTIIGDPFVLEETLGLSNINQLPLPPPHFTQVKQPGLLTFPDSAYTVPAHSSIQAEYVIDPSIAAGLPIGKKMTGKVKVSTPQLPAPVLITFDITHIRSRKFIFLFILLGVFCSFFIKTFVNNLREVETKRLLAGNLVQKIMNEIAPIKDVAYKQKIEGLYKALTELIRERYSIFPRKESLATSIDNEINNLTTAYNAAKEAFKTQHDQAQEALKKLGSLLTNSNTPVDIGNYLKPALAFYQQAQSDLVDLNPTDATINTNLALTAMKEGLQKYHQNISDLTGQVERNELTPAVADDPTKAGIATKVTALKQVLPTVIPADATQESIDTALKKAVEVHDNLSQLLNFLVETITIQFNKDNTNDNSPTMNNFIARFKTWTENINRLITDSTTPFNTQATTDLNTAWDAVKQEQATDRSMSDEAAPAFIAGRSLDWLRRNFPEAAAFFAVRRVNDEPLEVSLRRARANFILLSIISGLFILLLFTLAAYNFYDKDNYTGTFSELFAIFIAAFSMDMTLASVLAFASKKEQP